MSIVLDGTNGISDVDGSAATPAIRGTDANTGVYFPGADRIGFATGGSQRGEFDASGNFQFNSGYGSVAIAYGCRAWVNFNGTGTVAIRASGNVTSITDNNVGDYTVNFTNAMPDANYSWSAGGCSSANDFSSNNTSTFKTTTGVQLAGSLRIQTFYNSRPTGSSYDNGVADLALICVSVFR